MSFTARSYNVSCTVDDQSYNLYTCPAHCRTKMVLLYVIDVVGNNTVTVTWDRADSSVAHILGAKNMTAGEYIQWSDGYIVLEPGDEVNVVADGTTPLVDVFCTVEEFYKSTRPLG